MRSRVGCWEKEEMELTTKSRQQLTFQGAQRGSAAFVSAQAFIIRENVVPPRPLVFLFMW